MFLIIICNRPIEGLMWSRKGLPQRHGQTCRQTDGPFPIGGPLERSLNPAVSAILRSKRIALSVLWWNVVTSLTFQGHVTSSVTLPFDSPYSIFYWWSFGTVSEIFNVECHAMVDITLIRPLNKGQRSFILVPIDLSYTTSYRLSIVTFALRRTV